MDLGVFAGDPERIVLIVPCLVGSPCPRARLAGTVLKPGSRFSLFHPRLEDAPSAVWVRESVVHRDSLA